MTRTKEILLVISVAVILVGGWFILKRPYAPSLQNQQTLEVIKDTIINKKDCRTALLQLADFLKLNSRYAEAWQFQGVCQFQTGDTASAKVSFEKVLSLDSTMVSAQNYLKLISAGAKPVNTSGSFGAQTDLESKLGFIPDSKILQFQRIPINQSTSINATTTQVSMVGLYSSNKPESEILAYLTKTLSGTSFVVSKSKTNTTFTVTSVPGKKSYTISVGKTLPIQVLITYSGKESK